MKNKKALKISFVLLVLATSLIVGWYFFYLNHDKDKNYIYLYGNVDIREVQLSFRQNGRIDNMYFDEGDQVQAGTVLASIDPIPLEEKLVVAQANVLLAQAELDKFTHGLRPQEIELAQEELNKAQALVENATKNFNRNSKLLSSGAVSHQVFDQSKSEKTQALAILKAAQASLSQATEGYRQEDISAAKARLLSAKSLEKQANIDLQDSKLIAPDSGTIISRVREPGSMVNSQSIVYGLSLDKPVYIRAYIPEPNLGHIYPGSEVIVNSDSSDKDFIGKVGFISPKAEFTPKSVETTELRTDLVYRIRVVINDEGAIKSLRQGMPVTVKVTK